jgi:hypothetical protein
LQYHRGAQGILHLVEGLGSRRFFVQHLDNVKAVLGFHQVGYLPFIQAEGGLFKFRDGLSLGDPAQVATFIFRARIL